MQQNTYCAKLVSSTLYYPLHHDRLPRSCGLTSSSSIIASFSESPGEVNSKNKEPTHSTLCTSILHVPQALLWDRGPAVHLAAPNATMGLDLAVLLPILATHTLVIKWRQHHFKQSRVRRGQNIFCPEGKVIFYPNYWDSSTLQWSRHRARLEWSRERLQSIASYLCGSGWWEAVVQIF